MRPRHRTTAPRRLRAAAILAFGLLAAQGCDDAAMGEDSAAASPPLPRPAGLEGGAAAPRPVGDPLPTSAAAEAVLRDAASLGYRLMPDFEALAARVMPAVVSIAANPSAARGAAPPPSVIASTGSGFLIDPSGLIVTNRHVVGDAAEVTVALRDGARLRGRVVGVDLPSDAALLQVEARRPLPYVSLGDSQALRIGQWVLAAGNPFGLGGSASTGIVSALGRSIGVGPFEDFIQTDAAINPGNSGGPLFNLDGAVVGVNTAIYSPSGASAGVGFALPSARLRPVIEALAAGRPVVRGWIGVVMVDAPGAEGVRIERVLPGGPAERAGLRGGDVLVALNGEPVAGVRDVVQRITAIRPGEVVEVMRRRDGEAQAVELRIEQRPEKVGG